jgi:hypothetical protein
LRSVSFCARKGIMGYDGIGGHDGICWHLLNAAGLCSRRNLQRNSAQWPLPATRLVTRRCPTHLVTVLPLTW